MGSISSHACNKMHFLYTLCQQDVSTAVSDITIAELARSLYKSDYCTDVKAKSVSQCPTVTSDSVPTFSCFASYGNVSYKYVCDGVSDCFLGEDEKVCTFEYEMNGAKECVQGNFICRHPQLFGLICIPKDKVCNLITDCPDGSDESDCDSCTQVSCSSSVCIPRHWAFNCPFLNTKNTTDFLLQHTNQIQTNISHTFHSLLQHITYCQATNHTQGIHANNYNTFWAPKCVYIKDRKGNVIGCPAGNHLLGCSEFPCPRGYIKCWGAYCIPDYYLSDGYVDCPNGQDESKLTNFFLKNETFKCYQSKRTISHIYVCDGVGDCDRNDDEFDCSDQCPKGFLCNDETLTVHDVNTPHIQWSLISNNITYINMSGMDLGDTWNNIPTALTFNHLLVLLLNRCNISDSFRLPFHSNTVYKLEITNNFLTRLDTNFISNFTNLRILNVSNNNQLQIISSSFFKTFQKLKVLDLSWTIITYVNLKMNKQLVFVRLSNTPLNNLKLSPKGEYETIDLKNTNLYNFSLSNSLENISPKLQIFADYAFCCQVYRDPKIPNSLCNSDKPRLSSCDSLIGDMAKRILIWVIATVAIVGNIASLTYSLFFDRANLIKVNFALFVACLNISDLLMGVYLILIASVDIKYRGEYIYHEMSWRQSPLCQLAGVLATISSETSTLFVSLITVERFISVKYPHGEYRISSMVRYISIGLCFGLGLLLSVIPVMHPSMTLYSNSGMCLGFPLRKSSGPLWAFSVAVFVFFNSILLFLIACGQFLIYRMILKHNARRSSTVRSTNVSLASRLILVALSNLACFLPVSVIGMLVLVNDYKVEEVTYGWIVALALPVNSAINPLLYAAFTSHLHIVDSQTTKTEFQPYFSTNSYQSALIDVYIKLLFWRQKTNAQSSRSVDSRSTSVLLLLIAISITR
ncbi:G-protein coupled receptor GRL101-like [Biomphalaria glabrata]|uniref:G-protein coupled receptor GRL101-like n=1 Tax=Biomphalaria glabrata TaxID=6526 RepID=A0A9U8DWQ9_BIOGL|nr:G-protein coupled receptor GRL101-like [Biomphalaria glabrata]